ncbi:serine hydrolase domain-containing protein [Paraburkholderia sp. J67]|uniref:serine hydrolase domain-containing protein n=1 Tax=Paraburkholderia sp. J67 TaxID=2805435 RepID=UPI002ABE5E6C|nr:serine hydrolase domain-containing protein [Paraburkholderia sp. J67]
MRNEDNSTHGMSRERLSRIEHFFDETYVTPGKLPGAVIQVWRRGELALNATLGQRDRERQLPMTDDAIFRIYSMTKPVTSVAIMMLVEACKIALDDPVSKYIPEWQDIGVFAGGYLDSFQVRQPARPMQIVDLMRHTAGLTYGFQQNSNVDAAYRKFGIGDLVVEHTLEEMVAKLGKLPLEFSPGDAWNYSVATDVLGYLVAKISGKPLDVFLKECIFEPLGMVDTDFHVPRHKAGRFCACYAIGALGSKSIADSSPILQDDPQTSAFLEPPVFLSGGGGLVSTAADYMRFARMLLDGGELDGVRLLSPKTIALMVANHLPGGVDLPRLSRSMFSEANYAGVGFGLGFATTLRVADTLIPGSAGDFFWGGAASTFFWVDPQEELIGLFLTQLLPSSAHPIRRQLRTLVYSAITDTAR